MSENSVELYHNNGQNYSIEYYELIEDIALTESSYSILIVKNDGVARNITVNQDTAIYIQKGGSLYDGTINAAIDTKLADGYLEANGGYVEGLTVSGLAKLFNTATLTNATIEGKGDILLFNNSTAYNVTVGLTSTLQLFDSHAFNVQANALLSLSFASVENVEVINNGILIASANSTLRDITIRSGSQGAILNDGTILEGIISIAEPLDIGYDIDASQATVDFVLCSRTEKNDALISNWNKCQFANCNITVDAEQDFTSYVLADNASSFNKKITISLNTGTELGDISLSKALKTNGSVYSLKLSKNNTLSLSINKAYLMQISIDIGFSPTLELSHTSNDVIVYANKGMDIIKVGRWADDAEDDWKSSPATIKYVPNGAQLIDTGNSASPTVVFATPSSTWDNPKYMAHNENTDELCTIEGMNRFDDFIVSSGSETIIALTDGNDAIFADDIFTTRPTTIKSTSNSRLVSISEIHAGNGDDIIDMTMRHCNAVNEDIILHGDDGNDIIWAGNDGAKLYGDDGDDILVGGNGDDFLCGGNGNDTLRGLGGNNTYYFMANWGHDTIILEDGENYVLKFSQEINKEEIATSYEGDNLILTLGNNTITIINAANTLPTIL